MAITFAVAVFMTPIVLHRLGNEQYGIWAFLGIFSVLGYFSLLDMGMQGTAIKYIAEFHAKNDSKSLNQVINSVIFFFLAVGFVGAVFLLIINNLFLATFFKISPPEGKILLLYNKKNPRTKVRGYFICSLFVAGGFKTRAPTDLFVVCYSLFVSFLPFLPIRSPCQARG